MDLHPQLQQLLRILIDSELSQRNMIMSTEDQVQDLGLEVSDTTLIVARRHQTKPWTGIHQQAIMGGMTDTVNGIMIRE
jgi:hypothetical protein